MRIYYEIIAEDKEKYICEYTEALSKNIQKIIVYKNNLEIAHFTDIGKIKVKKWYSANFPEILQGFYEEIED